MRTQVGRGVVAGKLAEVEPGEGAEAAVVPPEGKGAVSRAGPCSSRPRADVRHGATRAKARPGRLSYAVPMPRYFFDETGTRDRDGLDLTGREQARAQAIMALPDMARDVLPDGEELTLAVAVREADGPVFFRATLTLKCEWFG